MHYYEIIYPYLGFYIAFGNHIILRTLIKKY